MFDKSKFHREITDSRRATPKTPVEAATHQSGLRVHIRARPDQSITDVSAALKEFSPLFKVEPLFPADQFEPDPDGMWSWGDHWFLGIAAGASYDDVSVNPWDVAHALRDDGGFSYVAPEVPKERAPDPVSDGDFTEGAAKWAHEQMRIKQAWEASPKPPGEGVLVASIDTGWFDHEIWDHGNLAKEHQRNVILPEEIEPGPDDARDRNSPGFPGHGHRTMSVIAAPNVPGARIVGVAHKAKVVPIRAVTTVILFPGQVEIARAIRWAVEKNCGVVSMSLGGPPDPLGPLYGAIGTAFDANTIVVAAAGQDIPLNYTAFPASNNRVFGVSGSMQEDKEWDPSSWRDFPGPFIPRSVHASAPALGVPIAQVDFERRARDLYALGTGTSYSTACVAGIAAMWLSHHFPGGYTGNWKALWRFRDHAHHTARRPGSWGNWNSGRWGMINAEALITTSPPGNKAQSPAEQALHMEPDTYAGYVEGLLAAFSGHESSAEGRILLSDLLGISVADLEAGGERVEMYAGEIVALLLDPDRSLLADVTSTAEQKGVCYALRQALVHHASSVLTQQLKGG